MTSEEFAMTDRRYDAVVFDLLTALIDSWSLWNAVAGSEDAGLRWRRRYLELTYQAGAYVPYEGLVGRAAVETGRSADLACELVRRWGELPPWPETHAVVAELARRVPLGIVTNCSQRLGLIAADRAGGPFAAVVTAESVGYYKPRSETYRAVLDALNADPARVLFVAGSAADVPGARGAGMAVYWHNRIGLKPLDGAPDFTETSLHRLLELV
jgi:2-haloalkanoic acid dehalogenase type II